MPQKKPELLEFLVLVHSPEGVTDWPHPVTISVHPRGETTILSFSVGPHVVNAGGQCHLDRVIICGEFNETYAEEFDVCNGRWLIPHLIQLAAGENVTANDLIGAYQSRFGHPPKTERKVELAT